MLTSRLTGSSIDGEWILSPDISHRRIEREAQRADEGKMHQERMHHAWHGEMLRRDARQDASHCWAG